MLGQDDHHHQLNKGKRTKRPRPALTISTSGDESCRVATSSSTTTTTTIINPTQEEEDMAHCLILLARGAAKFQKLTHTHRPESPAAVISVSAAAGGICVYECKTCNRCFSSFQALGGHRASHKKPKSPVETAPAPAISSPEIQDCFRSTENCKTNKAEELGLSLQMACNSSNTLSASNTKNHQSNAVKSNKVHACAICGSEFSSGQALGGHMRRHRPIATSGGGSPAAQPAISPAPARNLLCLDLNLPAEEQEEQQQQQESSKFVFGSSGKTLVFAANSLVDCRY